MKHIVSWSGGKDSTATIIAAHEMGLPIDLIIISLVWFDRKRKIYGEYPEHIAWIFNYAIPLFESWGYAVQVVSSERDYMYYFFHTIKKSDKPERIGKHAGWLLGGRCYMNREKIAPIKKYLQNLDFEYEEYIGIAIDEPERLARLEKQTGKRSLLAELGYTENMCLEKCREYGLLSPLYDISYRGGCWFCPNQKISGFAHLKQQHPILWAELLKLSKVKNKVTEGFKYGKTFDDVSREVDAYIKNQEYRAAQLTIWDAMGVENDAQAHLCAACLAERSKQT